MSALSNREHLSDRKQEVGWLEDILKTEFFAVIKKSCGESVEKYWLTGVLPAFCHGISPLSATQLISFEEQYNSLCGFTEMDVEAIIKRTLSEDEQRLAMSDIKSWYSGYRFSHSIGSKPITGMFNPQQVFVYLQKMISGSLERPHRGEGNSVQSATVLSVMGEPGIVTFHHLMDLLYSKKTTNVLTELSYRELMQKWSEDKTYYLLFYLGILTFDKDSGYLSVPNRCMHQLVSPKVSCF